MKNALIRPILSLRNPELLTEWWKKVEGGDGQAPPPPLGEIFKSETYSNFIYLFFKIGTEVNVFSHLGKVLFSHMKEAMFSDAPEPESDEEEVVESETGEDKVASGSQTVGQSVDTSQVKTNGTEDGSDCADCLDKNTVERGEEQTEEPAEDSAVPDDKAGVRDDAVVTSMYGKVYPLYKLKADTDPLL